MNTTKKAAAFALGLLLAGPVPGWEVAPLHDKAEHGTGEEVNTIIRSGVYVDFRTLDTEETALHRAAAAGNTGTMAVLIDYGADVNAVAGNGSQPWNRLPLTAAAEGCHSDAVELLLEKGADPNGRGGGLQKRTALHLAIERKCPGMAATLIAAGAEVDARTEYFGATPFMLAAEQGNTEPMQALADAGADIDAKRTKDGMIALGIAARLGKTGTVEKLIDLGADPDALDGTKVKMAAMHYAARNGHTETVKALKRKGANLERVSGHRDGITPLSSAAYGGNPDTTLALIKLGAKVNVRSRRTDTTPLMTAVEVNALEAAQVLIAHGADVHAFNWGSSWEETALHIAARLGHPDMARALVAAGAHVDVRRRHDGRTPLIGAAANGETETVVVLIALGADPNGRDESPAQYTAMHYAAGQGHPETVEALELAGASLELKTRHGGHRPLHDAAANRQPDTVRKLKELGANLRARTKYGKTARQIAEEEGYEEVAALLPA